MRRDDRARRPTGRATSLGALGPTNTHRLDLARTSTTRASATSPTTELVEAYLEQARGLVDGGADLLLVETIFDTLNAKAAIFALETLFEERGRRWPVIISGTITDASGPHPVRPGHRGVLELGAARPAARRRPQLRARRRARCGPTSPSSPGSPTRFVSCYPNAGLPNAFGEYDETPDQTAAVLEEFAGSGLVNLLGGCCGTTPEHIAAIAEAVDGKRAARRPARSRRRCGCPASSR